MTGTRTHAIDPVVFNDWFAIASSNAIGSESFETTLLGEPIALWRDQDAPLVASSRNSSQRFRAIDRYGYTWVSLGEPRKPLFALPEYDQPGRRLIDCGAFGVHTSGPRMIENFLDMGHFPYVHTGILGETPHTEVREYRVNVDDAGELWATDCAFWQPRAAAAAATGMVVDYVYRVMQPFSALLYKTCPSRPDQQDVIGLFVHPIGETESRAHLMVLVYDDEHDDSELIGFQQTIFGQDKPILENQVPARLPLEPRAEIPSRADASSIAYRRWLREKGLQFGVQR